MKALIKVQKPKVTSVQFAESGNDQPVALTKGKDYKVSYSKGCKKIGSYKVTVTYLGDFKKLKKVSIPFTITPAGTTIKKIKAQKKGFKVSWKKVNGGELIYAPYSKAKTVKTK